MKSMHLFVLILIASLSACGRRAETGKEQPGEPASKPSVASTGADPKAPPGVGKGGPSEAGGDPATGLGHVSVKLSPGSSAKALAMSPDGKRLAVGLSDGTITLRDTSTGLEVKALKGHDKAVSSLAFSGDGKTLVSGGDDKTVRLWDPARGEERGTLRGHNGRVLCVAVTPDGKTVASLENDAYAVKIWDAEQRKEKATHADLGSMPDIVAITPDGRRYVTGRVRVAVRDAATGKEVRALEGQEAIVKSIALSGDGKTAVTGDAQGGVTAWDLETGKAISAVKATDGAIESLAAPADGKRALVVSFLEARARLWDLGSKKALATGPKHDHPLDQAVAISADGSSLAYGGFGDLHIWATEAFIRQGQGGK